MSGGDRVTVIRSVQTPRPPVQERRSMDAAPHGLAPAIRPRATIIPVSHALPMIDEHGLSGVTPCAHWSANQSPRRAKRLTRLQRLRSELTEKWHAPQKSNKLVPANQVIVIYFEFGAILREIAADIFTRRSLRKAAVTHAHTHTRASFLTFSLTS